MVKRFDARTAELLQVSELGSEIREPRRTRCYRPMAAATPRSRSLIGPPTGCHGEAFEPPACYQAEPIRPGLI